jgi:2,4-dienoyl-CoA reductase-like NADH-dependent reductase (Old Yellow Enzyme family)
MYRRITDFIREQNAVPAIQLGHSGRKASVHSAVRDWKPLAEADAADGLAPWQGVSSSPLPDAPGKHIPKEMDRDDIRTVLDAWREAVRRSEDAGYDFLEIHGAHGYLIHQFLSPCSNKRTDAYGGDLQGRMRFALEVAEVVRAAWPDKPLSWRASCVDGQGGRWKLEDTIELAKALKERDIDMIDCSSGGIMGDSNMPVVPRVPGYQVGFSERIRREVDIPTIAVGLITGGQQAEDILQSGQADLVALARELLVNAEWPVAAAKELGVEDPFDSMPLEYAFRLRQREKHKELPVNQGGAETKAAMRAHLGGQG